MDKEEKRKYSEQWLESSSFFYNNNDYIWMCEQIEEYDTVLEIGCGTGYSTLALIEHGHKVIAVDNNEYCLMKAKSLIEESGYTYGTLEEEIKSCDVIFISADISDELFIERIKKLVFDAVICWNIGSYWTKNMVNLYVAKFKNYGLTLEQIRENWESSYSEYIIWEACKIASKFKIPIQLVDRSMYATNEENDEYYYSLKDEFKYQRIKFNSRKTVTKSTGGRVLSIKNQLCQENIISIFLISIILSYDYV